MFTNASSQSQLFHISIALYNSKRALGFRALRLWETSWWTFNYQSFHIKFGHRHLKESTCGPFQVKDRSKFARKVSKRQRSTYSHADLKGWVGEGCLQLTNGVKSINQLIILQLEKQANQTHCWSQVLGNHSLLNRLTGWLIDSRKGAQINDS